MKACISSIWSLSVESRMPLNTQIPAEINNAIANTFILPLSLIILKPVVAWFNIICNSKSAPGMPIANAVSSQSLCVIHTKIAGGFWHNWVIAVIYVCLEPLIPIGVDIGLNHVSAVLSKPTVEIYCDSPRWKTEAYWSSNIANLWSLEHILQTNTVLQAAEALLKEVSQ